MRLNARAFLTVLLVMVMLGSGVAFATGVNFSPQRAQFCLPNLFGYGPVCGTVKTAAKKKHKKHKKHKKKHPVSGKTISRGPRFTG
jgi:hypothetical protein